MLRSEIPQSGNAALGAKRTLPVWGCLVLHAEPRGDKTSDRLSHVNRKAPCFRLSVENGRLRAIAVSFYALS